MFDNKRWVSVLAALALSFQAYAPPVAGERAAVRQARLLVKFKHDVSRDAVADTLRRHGAAEFAPMQRARGTEPTPMDRWWSVALSAGSDPHKTAAMLRAEPAVEIVETESSYRVPQ